MRHLKLAPSWLQFLIVVLLALGVFLRFWNLDGKVYWHDETYTSLRISGYTAAEVKQQIFNGRIITTESFAKFQSPNLEKSLGDTIKSLAIEDPQHPPLYYVIARFWVKIFGNSVITIRSLSAFISLLVFPCCYWLCRELFNVPLTVPGLAIALMAISPIHLVYAQEAREYILWMVTVLLCSASLLQAIRLESADNKELVKGQQLPNRQVIWGIYAVTLALSLYTFLLSGFVAVSHGIYVLAIAKFRLTEIVKAYLLATLAGFFAFTPWIMVVIINFFKFDDATAWTKMQLPLETLIQSWLLQLSRIFFDLDFGFENNLSILITLIFFILVAYAIYFLCRTTHYKVWLFIVALIVVPALPLILPDLIFGGIRSLSERYLLPSYLGIQIAVAYLLATQIYNGKSSRRQIWRKIMMFLVICGLVSSTVSSQADTWWSKVISYGNPQVAKIINQTDKPLLMSDAFGINYGNIFSLSYLMQPKVRFLLVQEQIIPELSDDFTDIFLLNPSDSWRQEIEARYQATTNVVYGNNHYLLWKLSNYKNLR
ncbi:glycosyltransferase family 39 protein [Nostocales cyanobacterium LEGE 11386]|nr:glycosyltransferase family 39 protein [Nostocales cyanobacterium LEGE 11386]